MKNLLLILSIILVLASCSSKKHISEVQTYEREFVQDVKDTKTDSVVEVKDITTTIDILDSSRVIIVEKEFTIIRDTVSGDLVSVKTSEKTTTKESGTKTRQVTEDKSKTDRVVESKTTNITTEIEKEETEKEEKREFKNTAIVKGFYSLVILFLIAAIIIRKFFPSIFVKAKKFLTL